MERISLDKLQRGGVEGFHACTGIIPRSVAAVAFLTSICALLFLANAWSYTVGTSATILPAFRNGCLGVAKWSAIVGGCALGVAFVTDLAYAIYKKGNSQEGGKRFAREMGISILASAASPFVLFAPCI